MVTIKGKVSEIGNLGHLNNGCGVMIESADNKIAVIGLTVADCKLIGKYFGEELEIKIALLGKKGA